MKLTFTAAQLALLGAYFFDNAYSREALNEVAVAVYEFVSLRDPYDLDLVVSFVDQALPENELVRSKVETNKEDKPYFIGKCVYWAEKGLETAE